MALLRRLFGAPLRRSQAASERLPSYVALPILSSDALSSVAYATEVALGVLILAGSSALALSLPITLVIIGLITIVVFSYRQTIEAYPRGGGSYVVARENLGTGAGLLAAAALLVDYTLTAGVSLMAGTQALTSLVPALRAHEVAFALLLLVVVGWANLRGLKEAGKAFALPTYAFVGMVALLTLFGLQDLLLHHGFRPDPPPLVAAVEPLGLFLILRAFSSGCSAMTGIEAIANGVQVFREPAAPRARATLLALGLMLSAMVLAISGLAYLYGVAPSPDHTVMAQIGARVFGPGSPLLWALQLATLLILVLAANTAFAGFPRLAAMLAQDHFLPRQMGWLGDRLVFQNGIAALVLATAVIIVVCRGDTTVAVNLYALGVFLAFTLSQAGMVVLWWRRRGAGWHGRLLMNAVGGVTTAVVLAVIAISKFAEGAWMVVIAIPLLVAMLARIGRRYRRVLTDIALAPDQIRPVRLRQRREPVGNRSLVWIASLTRPSLEALHYAARVSDQVVGVWVLSEGDDPAEIRAQWQRVVGDDPGVELRLLESPYASLIEPFVELVEQEQRRPGDQSLTIVMPMAIPRYPLDGLLLNQRGINMRKALDAHHNQVYTLVRYYLPD